jgi:tryptophan halogenase
MAIPESLAHKIALFEANARAVRDNNEMFRERSWAAVMLGQGIEPGGYHPFVDNLTDAQLEGLTTEIKSSVNNIVMNAPTHQDFLKRYCAGGKPQAF